MAESFLQQASASRFHFARLLYMVLRQSTVKHQQHSPAWDVSHPSENFDQVSTWSCSFREAIGEIVDVLYDLVLVRCDCRVAIDDRQYH